MLIGDSGKSGDVCVVCSGDSDSSQEGCEDRSGEVLELEHCDCGVTCDGEELEPECCDCGVTCDGESGNSVGVENSREDREAGLGDSGIDVRREHNLVPTYYIRK